MRGTFEDHGRSFSYISREQWVAATLVRPIIQRHGQIPVTFGHPLMGRAVVMQNHAGQGLTGPLLAMRPTPGRPHLVSRPLQPVLRPRIGARTTMLRLQALMKCLTVQPVYWVS